MKRYRAIANFSVGERKYFKGVVYNELPPVMRNFFQELQDEKKEIIVEDEVIETASVEPKVQKRKRRK